MVVVPVVVPPVVVPPVVVPPVVVPPVVVPVEGVIDVPVPEAVPDPVAAAVCWMNGSLRLKTSSQTELALVMFDRLELDVTGLVVLDEELEEVDVPVLCVLALLGLVSAFVADDCC